MEQIKKFLKKNRFKKITKTKYYKFVRTKGAPPNMVVIEIQRTIHINFRGSTPLICNEEEAIWLLKGKLEGRVY